MTFLESYFESRFTPKEFIVTGLSLGGHVAWDSLARIPLIKSAVIIVGCPNLTPMLLERLGGYRSADEVPSGTKEWPKSLEKLYVARDKSLESISGKRILILNGAIDELVPSKFTVPWVEKFGANNEVEFLEGANTGHWLSWEMTEKMVEWIVKTVI
jgi:pimeloyl-ACP methyl ester carboxylesterase